MLASRFIYILCEPRPDPGHAVPQVTTIVTRGEGEDEAEDEEQLAKEGLAFMKASWESM